MDKKLTAILSIIMVLVLVVTSSLYFIDKEAFSAISEWIITIVTGESPNGDGGGDTNINNGISGDNINIGGDVNIDNSTPEDPEQHIIKVYLDPTIGEVSDNEIKVVYNHEYGSIPTPKKEGMTFLGWYNESGTKVTENSIVKTYGDHTLIARWGVTLSFDTNDGESQSIKSYQVVYDEKYGKLPILTKENAEFQGWYTSLDYDVKITSDTIVSIQKDHTLYAKWHYPHLTFTLMEDSYSVRATDVATTSKNVAIPSVYNGKMVDRIESNGFKDCKNLKNLTIPNSITFIGAYAFSGCSIQNIYITDVDAWVKINCCSLYYEEGSLGEYEVCISYRPVGETLHVIDKNGKEVTNVAISEGITFIGPDTFRNCKNITSITLPNSTEYIGAYAFAGCSKLTGLTIPGNVDFIGYSIIDHCDSLGNVLFADTKGWKIYGVGWAFIYRCYDEIIFSEIADPKTALTYLMSKYNCYEWRKNYINTNAV